MSEALWSDWHLGLRAFHEQQRFLDLVLDLVLVGVTLHHRLLLGFQNLLMRLTVLNATVNWVKVAVLQSGVMVPDGMLRREVFRVLLNHLDRIRQILRVIWLVREITLQSIELLNVHVLDFVIVGLNVRISRHGIASAGATVDKKSLLSLLFHIVLRALVEIVRVLCRERLAVALLDDHLSSHFDATGFELLIFALDRCDAGNLLRIWRRCHVLLVRFIEIRTNLCCKHQMGAWTAIPTEQFALAAS